MAMRFLFIEYCEQFNLVLFLMAEDEHFSNASTGSNVLTFLRDVVIVPNLAVAVQFAFYSDW